jgi:hypothetical protein
MQNTWTFCFPPSEIKSDQPEAQQLDTYAHEPTTLMTCLQCYKWTLLVVLLIKDVQKWVNQKLLKNPMKKKVFYNISKDQSSKIG